MNISSFFRLKLDFKESKYATGRRKKSIAKVWLKKGSGSIYVNGKKMSEYFKKPNLQTAVYRPLSLTKRENEFDIRCSVNGGGLSGQVGAIIHGISRALVEVLEDNKVALKEEGLMTRDPRMVERKKPGQPKARKKFQFSKR